jgi:hypothetical protein
MYSPNITVYVHTVIPCILYCTLCTNILSYLTARYEARSTLPNITYPYRFQQNCSTRESPRHAKSISSRLIKPHTQKCAFQARKKNRGRQMTLQFDFHSSNCSTILSYKSQDRHKFTPKINKMRHHNILRTKNGFLDGANIVLKKYHGRQGNHAEQREASFEVRKPASN